MKKIEGLTAAQEIALREYREEWLAHGRSCAPADRPTTEAAIRSMYAAISEPAPKMWWCPGPALGTMVRAVLNGKGRDNLWDNLGANLRDNLWDNLRDNLWDNLRANLWANLRANLRDNLWDNLGANLRANLRDNLWDNLGANLWANLRDNLGANLGANLWANLRANLGDNLAWGFWGQHEAAWPAFYAWPDSALRTMHTDDQKTKLSWWLNLSRSCGWWQPYKSICFLCERPERQAVDTNGRLHLDGAPALLCRDGWPVHALHGVRMKAEYVETPAERIAPETVLAESNVDVRRELIRKVGVERMLAKLPHRVIEKKGDYELLAVRLSEQVGDARYLKMINPSVGCFHIEGIEPSCKTVTEALNWRNNNWFSDAEALT